MKQFYLFVSVCLLSTLSTFAQVPTNGLVGRYPFNNNANDISGNGYDGIVYGATPTTDRFNAANAAYSVNNTYIQIPEQILLNKNIYSYCIWIKPNNLPNNNQVIFSVGGANNNNPGDGFDQHCSYSTTGHVFGSSYNYGNNPIQSFVDGGYIPINQWTHVAVTRDNSLLKLYVNGILITSSSNSINNEPAHYGLATNKRAIIGGRCYLESQYFFNGSVDDIYLYDRVLSSTEINNIMHAIPCTETVYDTVTVYNTITIHDTVHVTINDTILVYDTVEVLKAVSDTLLISTKLNGLSSPNNQNTIKVYPNPAKNHLFIDNGNYGLMVGYQLKVVHTSGQQVYQTYISQQLINIDLNTWLGSGTYFVYLIDPANNIKDIKKIIIY